MNPLEEYISIIHQRQQNPLPKEEYGEVHHIIPRSLGGCDKAWNKVRLTPEEHFSCHYLLTFIYATGEAHEAMVYAWNQLSGRITGDLISSEEYGRLRREFAKIHSKRMKGKRAGIKHGPMPKEIRERISNTAKQVVHTDEWNANVSKAKKGVKKQPLSEETRMKLSATLSGHPGWNKGKCWTDAQKAKLKGRIPWNKGLSGPGSPMFGKKHSPETIQRMREAAARRKAATG